MKSILCILVMIILGSCEKDNIIIPEITPSIIYGDLQVEVSKCIDPPACQALDPILGANVYVYYSEEMQESGNNEARFNQTNTKGIATFNNLDSSIVYISVVYDTIINKSIERVPQNSLTYHLVVF